MTAVELQDGTSVPTDVVLGGIGASRLLTGFASSGLTLQDGVACNAFCEASPDIYATGDVANWYLRSLDGRCAWNCRCSG